MTQGLTQQQADLLGYLRNSDRTPSYAEMARAIGLKSRSGIFRLIEALETRGFIERLPNKSRAVRLLEEPRLWSDVSLRSVSTSNLIGELRRRGVKVAA